MKIVKSKVRKTLLAYMNVPSGYIEKIEVAIVDLDFNNEVAERVVSAYILNKALSITKEYIMSIREDREFKCYEVRTREVGTINTYYKSRMNTYIVMLFEDRQDIDQVLQKFYIEAVIEASKEMVNR